jgi:hypothetical protein
VHRAIELHQRRRAFRRRRPTCVTGGKAEPAPSQIPSSCPGEVPASTNLNSTQKTWMAGTSPAMTGPGCSLPQNRTLVARLLGDGPKLSQPLP